MIEDEVCRHDLRPLMGLLRVWLGWDPELPLEESERAAGRAGNCWGWFFSILGKAGELSVWKSETQGEVNELISFICALPQAGAASSLFLPGDSCSLPLNDPC